MANIKSAKKRINTINRQKAENKLVKSTLSTYIKKFKVVLNSGDIAKAEAQLKETVSYINNACSKGIIHKNNASRKIGRLSAALDKVKKNAKVEVKEVKEKVEVKEEKEAPAKKATAEPKTEKKTTKKTTKKDVE